MSLAVAAIRVTPATTAAVPLPVPDNDGDDERHLNNHKNRKKSQEKKKSKREKREQPRTEQNGKNATKQNRTDQSKIQRSKAEGAEKHGAKKQRANIAGQGAARPDVPMQSKHCACHAKAAPIAASTVPATQKLPGPSGDHTTRSRSRAVKVLCLTRLEW